MKFIYFTSGVLLLGTFGWIIAKTSVFTRTIIGTIALCVCVCTAYSCGRASQKMLFLGSHIRGFEDYSGTLKRLASENRLEDLSKAVIWFDEKWKKDTQSSSNIVILVSELEKMYGHTESRTRTGL